MGFDTSATIRLRSPSRSPPDASHDAFSSSLTTTVFSQRSMRWFEASLRRATPKGQDPSSPPQHRIKDPSYIGPSLAFRTHFDTPQVKHMLQRADPVPTDSRQGGPSRTSGTHRSGPFSVRVNEEAALPCPQVVLSCRSERYYGRLRLPPGTPPTSRLHTGYRTASSAPARSTLRPGRVSPVPAATI